MTPVEDPFVLHRSLLFTIAYEMLGVAADAEDVVQETWLRWDGVGEDARSQVRDPRAYLVRIVTRQALNRLRTLARRREEYVGEWLPEPLLTAPDVAEDAELAESLSLAVMTVLETLTPTERAVFVLREVFELPYAEIAESVGKGEAAVRQIAHRAREHVAARRPRVAVDVRERAAVIDRFVAALRGGDLQSLFEVMSPDVVLVADGGGVKKAALRPIYGVEKVLRFLVATSQRQNGIHAEPVWVNGEPAMRVDIDGELDNVVTADLVDGKVVRLYLVRNPHKLGRVTTATQLSR